MANKGTTESADSEKKKKLRMNDQEAESSYINERHDLSPNFWTRVSFLTVILELVPHLVEMRTVLVCKAKWKLLKVPHTTTPVKR